MSKAAFIFAAFSLALAAPAFAASHQGGLSVAIADAPNLPASSSAARDIGDRHHSDLFAMHPKLDQASTEQDCTKQINLLTGRVQNVCTVLKN